MQRFSNYGVYNEQNVQFNKLYKSVQLKEIKQYVGLTCEIMFASTRKEHTNRRQADEVQAETSKPNQ